MGLYLNPGNEEFRNAAIHSKIYETLPNGKRKNKMFWSYKERNYANMQPEVKKGGEYSFHMAYARAFRLF